jgi:hypothetical protein
MKAILPHLLLGGLLILAAEPVCAQGFHFGGGFGGGFRFVGPGFAGPRYDGPGYDAPGYGGPSRAGPSRDAPIHDAPVRDAPLHDAPGRDDPDYDAPVHDNPHFRESVDMPPREGPPGDGAHKCFNPAETRLRVPQLKLREPFEMMRRAATIASAQALAGKLCRWADLDVYDISLLRPNGRVVHVFLDAQTGRVVSAPHMN